MKKSTLALLFTSAVVLSACDNQANVKLQDDLQKVQMQLQEANKTIAILSEQNNNKEQALKVSVVELFNKKQNIMLSNIAEENAESSETENSISLSVNVSTATTGVQWLDNLLLEAVYYSFSNSDNPLVSDENLQKQVSKFLEQFFADKLSEMQASKEVGVTDKYFNVKTDFIGQRNNVAVFKQTLEFYEGGAHPVSNTTVINVNLAKQSVVNAVDLVNAVNLPRLAELLWKDYVKNYATDGETFADKADFYVSDNFYITTDGVEFTYPQYVLGPYSDGEITLNALKEDLNKLLADEYKFNHKNGYSLSEEN